MKVQAAVCRKVGAPLEIEEVEVRKPLHGELLVKLRASGICHTDLSVQNGSFPFFPLPIILGHEGILPCHFSLLTSLFSRLSSFLFLPSSLLSLSASPSPLIPNRCRRSGRGGRGREVHRSRRSCGHHEHAGVWYMQTVPLSFYQHLPRIWLYPPHLREPLPQTSLFCSLLQ